MWFTTASPEILNPHTGHQKQTKHTNTSDSSKDRKPRCTALTPRKLGDVYMSQQQLWKYSTSKSWMTSIRFESHAFSQPYNYPKPSCIGGCWEFSLGRSTLIPESVGERPGHPSNVKTTPLEPRLGFQWFGVDVASSLMKQSSIVASQELAAHS